MPSRSRISSPLRKTMSALGRFRGLKKLPAAGGVGACTCLADRSQAAASAPGRRSTSSTPVVRAARLVRVAAGLAITWRAGRRELITMAVLELLSGVGVAVEVIVGRRALEAILVTGAVRHRGGGGGDVQLSGSQRVALRDVSLHISPGEVVALVGANGSGKTTLAKVLAGLYLPSRGRVCWDGRDTREVDSRELLSHTAIVFQDFIRYALPAGDNIALGPAFVDGTDLPTGQWQRVALARTFFRDAPLVILDEPTAALDAKAEHELFGRIGELFADRSVLLISHRFSTVRSADRIYVLNEGCVVESGTHEELVAAGGTYAELFALQASPYQ